MTRELESVVVDRLRAYRWRCEDCGALNIEAEEPLKTAVCGACGTSFRVEYED